MSSDNLKQSYIEQSQRYNNKPAEKMQFERDKEPLESGVDFKKKLTLWAAKRNGSVTISSISSKISPNATQKGEKIEQTAIECSFIASKHYTRKLGNENYEQCEQRAARNFLRIYLRSPFK